ncbi:hypothetical protein CASFOL_038330 [Castilleja foliolosa]|uniref:TORTIFOLIA1/SINE1-2 N-terminal domain-containing protein n=1 Tax=Castilleja foliolosa TaxID=1961234 RepID=A0ABD3BLH7_9LAMI
MSGFNAAKQANARDLKHRVLTCLHKLSDRDTHSAAASELESIAKSLSADALPSFLSSISATDSSDKSPVRRHCVKLISVLSEHHKNSLSPYLSKLLSSVVRRLRDPDTAVRSACVAATLSLSSNLTSPPFTSIAKPFIESLFTEQDQNAQTGAALCLAATIEGSRNPDAASLRKLLPRLEKLAKCDSFKSKAALLALIGSVVEVEGLLSSGGKNVIRNLITCLMEFLSSDDWAARKAAAEVLMKIAAVEKDKLAEYKISCLKAFEAKKFDKVKAAREMMNQMIEAWKQIPDLTEEISLPPESEASAKENASDGRYTPGPKTSLSIRSTTPHIRKKNLPGTPSTRTPFADGSPSSTDKKRSPLESNGNKTGPPTAMFQKLGRKRAMGLKVETVSYNGSSDMNITNNSTLSGQGDGKQFVKREVKRALFTENNEKPKLNLFNKFGSRVVPCGDDSVVISNETGGVRNQRESDELSLIRKQLLQIENQQSSLLDLLQKFIGSSQNGMHSLEARVHGLELSLDEISFDLAVSTGRMSQNSPSRAVCCKLPGTEFLSSKLWRKAANRPSASRLPASRGTLSTSAIRSISDNIGASEGFPARKSRFLLRGGRGEVIVNPLAKLSSGSMGYSDASSSGVGNNIRF